MIATFHADVRIRKLVRHHQPHLCILASFSPTVQDQYEALPSRRLRMYKAR